MEESHNFGHIKSSSVGINDAASNDLTIQVGRIDSLGNYQLKHPRTPVEKMTQTMAM